MKMNCVLYGWHENYVNTLSLMRGNVIIINLLLGNTYENQYTHNYTGESSNLRVSDLIGYHTDNQSILCDTCNRTLYSYISCYVIIVHVCS